MRTRHGYRAGRILTGSVATAIALLGAPSTAFANYDCDENYTACIETTNSGTVGTVGVSAQTAGGTAITATDTAGGYALNATSSGTVVLATGGQYGVSGSGTICGVTGTTSTSGYFNNGGLCGGANSGNGVWAHSISGFGVYSTSDDSDAGHFLAYYNGTSGLYAQNSNTGSSVYTVGVRALSAGSAGAGVRGENSSSGYGVYGSSSSGTGIYGIASTSGAGVSGTSSGGSGVSGSSSSGDGVYGGSGSSNGVYGTSSSGYGVYANSTGSYGLYAVSSESDAIYATSTGTNGVVGISSYLVGVQGTTSGTASESIGIAGFGGGGSSFAGYFTGNVEITGTLNGMTPSSDARLKTNIQALDASALDKLMSLHGVTFDWKDPATYGKGEQTGFIAQDVEKVFPSWVTENKDGTKRISMMRGFEALELESIRALKMKADKSEAENHELRAQVAKLQGQVALLDGDHAKLALLADHLDKLENGKDPMTGDRGMLWMVAMFVAVGGGVIVTRKQNQKQA
jgi:hypothetical protein